MTSLGEYIKQLRDKRDLSLRELAEKLGCSAAFLSDVELGRRFPSERLLSDIAKALGTTSEDLRAHDIRAPIEEIKRLTAANPTYAAAFRAVVDKNLSPEKLMELLGEKKITKKPKEK